MIKAAFFDIDGTLLTDNGEILESTVKAIEKLHQQNVLCCIASGRGPNSIESLVGKLPMDAYVLYNGQLVFSHDTGIHENYFDQDTLIRLATLGETEDRQMIFGSRKKYFGSQSMRLGQKKWLKHLYNLLPGKLSFRELNRLIKKRNVFLKKEHPFLSLPIFDKPIYQCVMLCPVEEQERLETLFPDCTFTRSNPYFVDVIPKGGSKMIGIREALAYYGISPEEAIAFGDSLNDTEMLSEIGIGVAMGNAMEEIKELADYVTDSNEDNGIYNALVQFKMIR